MLVVLLVSIVYVCEGVCVSAHTCVWRPEVDVGIVCDHFPSYRFRIASSAEPEACRVS